jgi:hypothetical protein
MLPAVLGWALLLARELTQSAVDWFERRRPSAAPALFLSLAALTCIEYALPLAYASAELRDLPAVARAVRRSMTTPELDALAGPGKLVLLASAADPTTTIYLNLARQAHGRSGPSSCQLLMGGYGPLKLTRTASAAFEVERLQTDFTGFDVYAAAFNRLPMSIGDRFQSGWLSVEVLDTREGRPMRARYFSSRPLDDEAVVLLTQTHDGLQRVEVPAMGESRILAPAELPLGLLDSPAP